MTNNEESQTDLPPEQQQQQQHPMLDKENRPTIERTNSKVKSNNIAVNEGVAGDSSNQVSNFFNYAKLLFVPSL